MAKAIMYHYIRNKSKLFPYSNILKKKDFERQLKFFNNSGLISDAKQLILESNKYILTFDDGLKDHIYAAESLKKYNAIGLFAIPTLPFKNKDILDVHKIHLITGKIKGLEIMNELKKYITRNKIENFINENEKEKYKIAYKAHKDDSYKKEFKKIMNYYSDIKLKRKILNYLLKKFDINIKSKDFYLNKKEIKYLSSLGMVIGSHTESHTLLSRLNYKKQFLEIKNSKVFLEKVIKKEVDTFVHPYGTKVSYNKNTINILKKLKFKLAYSVENRDIKFYDIKNNPFELPRYDCNQFI
jgi:peptidoglycan/xylan/chitin deacetylase (PgdA/CDA1 family)